MHQVDRWNNCWMLQSWTNDQLEVRDRIELEWSTRNLPLLPRFMWYLAPRPKSSDISHQSGWKLQIPSWRKTAVWNFWPSSLHFQVNCFIISFVIQPITCIRWMSRCCFIFIIGLLFETQVGVPFAGAGAHWNRFQFRGSSRLRRKEEGCSSCWPTSVLKWNGNWVKR